MHHISLLYMANVVEHLLLCWINIWMRTYTITTTNIDTNLGELAEIQGDVSGPKMPLRYS
jgi:hypothetical protein